MSNYAVDYQNAHVQVTFDGTESRNTAAIRFLVRAIQGNAKARCDNQPLDDLVPDADSSAKVLCLANLKVWQVVLDLVRFKTELFEFGQKVVEVVADLPCNSLDLLFAKQSRVSKMKSEVHKDFTECGNHGPCVVLHPAYP